MYIFLVVVVAVKEQLQLRSDKRKRWEVRRVEGKRKVERDKPSRAKPDRHTDRQSESSCKAKICTEQQRNANKQHHHKSYEKENTHN